MWDTVRCKSCDARGCCGCKKGWVELQTVGEEWEQKTGGLEEMGKRVKETWEGMGRFEDRMRKLVEGVKEVMKKSEDGGSAVGRGDTVMKKVVEEADRRAEKRVAEALGKVAEVKGQLGREVERGRGKGRNGRIGSIEWGRR